MDHQSAELIEKCIFFLILNCHAKNWIIFYALLKQYVNENKFPINALMEADVDLYLARVGKTSNGHKCVASYLYCSQTKIGSELLSKILCTITECEYETFRLSYACTVKNNNFQGHYIFNDVIDEMIDNVICRRDIPNYYANEYNNWKNKNDFAISAYMNHARTNNIKKNAWIQFEENHKRESLFYYVVTSTNDDYIFFSSAEAAYSASVTIGKIRDDLYLCISMEDKLNIDAGTTVKVSGYIYNGEHQLGRQVMFNINNNKITLESEYENSMKLPHHIEYELVQKENLCEEVISISKNAIEKSKIGEKLRKAYFDVLFIVDL